MVHRHSEVCASRRNPLAAALRRKAELGVHGGAERRAVAAGEGWSIADILCTCGPRDRSFEERSGAASIALVLSGSFAFRDARGAALLTPGSLLLVNPEHAFECTHHHGEGDRCLSFQYDAELFAHLAHDAGAARPGFALPALPPVRALAGLTARAAAVAAGAGDAEALALELAGAVVQAAGETRSPGHRAEARAHAAVSRALREMEHDVTAPHTVAGLARSAGLSPYHFLRTFKAVTGVTPHQWLLRARLRAAALQLATSKAPVTEVALEAGFEDLSNFMRSFRAEFGVSPRRYRLAA